MHEKCLIDKYQEQRDIKNFSILHKKTSISFSLSLGRIVKRRHYEEEIALQKISYQSSILHKISAFNSFIFYTNILII